ncbi:MAG: hypothetical protein GY832_46080 [Chloroflexi bacterium]|nr:hypothetical protein [Chloroflexota bacterium]
MDASLFLSLPTDMGGGVLIAILGIACGAVLVLFVGIAVLEATIRMLMDWPSKTALHAFFLLDLIIIIILGILA